MKKVLFVCGGVTVLLLFAAVTRFLETRQVVEEPLDLGLQVEESETTQPLFENFALPAYGTTIDDIATSARVASYPEAEAYLEDINAALLDGPNFAGVYTIATWSCGEQCQLSAIVHAATGDILEFGILSSFGLSYQKDSTLLIVNPREKWGGVTGLPEELAASFGADYYVFEGERLTLLFTDEGNGRHQTNCPEISVQARHGVLDTVKTFPSRCKVPSGWTEEQTNTSVLPASSDIDDVQ